MGKKYKSLKRHQSLQPLSRHHQLGLFVALKLKRAGTKDSRWSIDEIIQDLKDFWEPEGQQHFREEEEILIPAFAQYASIDRREMIELLLEHTKIRALIDTILQTDERDIAKMNELGELLERHIRKEERVVFPLIERTLPEEKLVELAPYFH